MDTAMKKRILGGLWGAIVGDALGVPVDFSLREERRSDPVTEMRGSLTLYFIITDLPVVLTIYASSLLLMFISKV
jgi:hypothetical protein